MNKKKVHSLITILFSCTILIAMTYLGSLIFDDGIPVESNILKLLPKSQTPIEFDQKITQFSDLMERKVLFIISDSSNNEESFFVFL